MSVNAIGGGGGGGAVHQASRAPAPAGPFEELFGFYRDSGFLYPAKLAALAPRLPAIEQTWRRLLAADPELFRLFTNRAPDGTLLNSICAFMYAPGTWHGQHLVSIRRHEYVGTLSVLTALVQWFHDAGVEHARLSFRPDNPGTNRLFGAVSQRLPNQLANVSIVDYALVRPGKERLPPPRLTIERLACADAHRASAFYRRVLHPVDLASLRLDDLELEGMNNISAAHGLTRRRRVLVATDRQGVVGAAVVNRASEGMNFSFLENAVEYLRVAPDLSRPRRREVWHALVGAALAHAREANDDVVLTLDPADRDLALDAALMSAEPKQYAVLTVTRHNRGFLRSIDCFNDYYRVRLEDG